MNTDTTTAATTLASLRADIEAAEAALVAANDALGAALSDFNDFVARQ